MKVTPVLAIDLTAAVEPFGFLDGAAAARLMPEVPRGAYVELYLGEATSAPGDLGELLQALRPAAATVIRGSSRTGIEALARRIRIALPDVRNASC